MDNGAHILIRHEKNKKILEHGWDESEVYKMSHNLCLTKPSDGGSTMNPHSWGWTVWDLTIKEEIAQFTKQQDAVEYFKFRLRSKP